jgi:hypothetical protein
MGCSPGDTGGRSPAAGRSGSFSIGFFAFFIRHSSRAGGVQQAVFPVYARL